MRKLKPIRKPGLLKPRQKKPSYKSSNRIRKPWCILMELKRQGLAGARPQTQGVSSRRQPRLARLRKTSYQSCDTTDSAWKSTRFQCAVNFGLTPGPWRVNFLFMWNKIFDGIVEKLLPTKAAPIASLHLSIIHWSLSTNMTRSLLRAPWGGPRAGLGYDEPERTADQRPRLIDDIQAKFDDDWCNDRSGSTQAGGRWRPSAW